MDDYIIFVTQTKRYQILKAFANEQEASEYARTVEVNEGDLEDTEEDRWAEAQ